MTDLGSVEHLGAFAGTRAVTCCGPRRQLWSSDGQTGMYHGRKQGSDRSRKCAVPKASPERHMRALDFSASTPAISGLPQTLVFGQAVGVTISLLVTASLRVRSGRDLGQAYTQADSGRIEKPGPRREVLCG